MADSKSILQIAKLGLLGKKAELVDYLQFIAAEAVNSNKRTLYSSIKKLLNEFSLDTKKSFSVSHHGESPISDDFSNIDPALLWIPKKVENQLTQFITFFKNRKNVNSQRLLSHFNKLLLYGPPGTGKTTIGMQIWHKLGLPTRYVRISDVMSSKFGETLKNIADLFASPWSEVIFIDEFDAFWKTRDDSHDVGELKRTVNSIIQTFDFHSQNKVVIVATNLIETIDPALLRRFPFKIHVDFLDHDEGVSFLHFLISQHPEFNFNITEEEARFIITTWNYITVDTIRTFFDKCLFQASVEEREDISFSDMVVTLLFHEWIIKINPKSLKKENPIQLQVIAQVLKNSGYTQEQISKIFGIHRNSYKKYFT